MGAKWSIRSLPCGRASAYCLCPAIPTPPSSAMGTLARPLPSCKNHLAPPFLAEKFARCLTSWFKKLRECLAQRRPKDLRRLSEPTILGACRPATPRQALVGEDPAILRRTDWVR